MGAGHDCAEAATNAAIAIATITVFENSLMCNLLCFFSLKHLWPELRARNAIEVVRRRRELLQIKQKGGPKAAFVA